MRQLAGWEFGLEPAAEEWPAGLAKALDRQVPAEALGNEQGRKLVHTILIQLDHGVHV